ncbi:hypothetical protein P8452_68452 [Trifolium repens]|nr:ribosome production factor protein [Trifolium repens]WJX86093.1 hypothetical protein P8452_68452 [Trifolium repens]
MESFTYDKKLPPKEGSKPFMAFIGEGFESVNGLKHLKEVLLDLFRGEVVENLNLAGVDRAYVCTALSSTKKLAPSMEMVIRRHRPPNESVRKEAMRTSRDKPKKKEKNVKKDPLQGKIGNVYIPDQKIGEMALPNKSKGVKRERREAKQKHGSDDHASKKKKEDS